MKNYILSKHAADIISEREINHNWLDITLNHPDEIIQKSYDEVHYLKSIAENDKRYLRVIINPISDPIKIVTLFFDRRVK